MSHYKRAKVLTAATTPGNSGTRDLSTEAVMVIAGSNGRATFQDNFGNTFDVYVAANETKVVEIGAESFWGTTPSGITAYGLYNRGPASPAGTGLGL
jgi:hypothetical protein